MTKKNRCLFPGGFAAALTCLVMLTGCPGPMQPVDTGMPPDDDGGMPPDDGSVPPPDAYTPPDGGGMPCSSHADCMGVGIGAGMACVRIDGANVCGMRCSVTVSCESGTWCTDGTAFDGSPMDNVCLPRGDACSPEMMRDRVSPPCDPDTRTGAGTGPTGLEEFARSGVAWFSSISGTSCTVRLLDTSFDSMGRIALYVGCENEDLIEPYLGVFYLDRDGCFYANAKNGDTQEWARACVEPGPILRVERMHGGETVPHLMYTSSP